MYLDILTHRKKPIGVLRTSYREGGKVKHRQHGMIKDMSLEELKNLKALFRCGLTNSAVNDAVEITKSREYGASYAVWKVAENIGLDKVIYSRKESWSRAVLAMIIGRILYAGSKLSLCKESRNSCLFELAGIEDTPDVERDCYKPLDELLARQVSIQKKLAAMHLSDGCMVMYDITSSYLEGEYSESELVKFGYNRDDKKGRKQIVIGLICNKEGCPVAVEVFAGNTKDESTVASMVNQLKEKYKLNKLIFVGDRGMLTKCNLDKLEGTEGLQTITALTHNQINSLLENKIVQPGLFDEKNITEVTDANKPGLRYCLCRNPYTADRENRTRDKLLELIKKEMDKIASYVRPTTVEVIGARVGKVLAKYKVGKLIKWSVEADKEKAKSSNHELLWEVDEDKLAEERSIDGCYVITTTVSAEDMSEQEVVESYKRLTLVEQAFRNLKTVQIEMRPIYHRRDDRIRAHVFLCMLSYYVQWHMKQLLKPLFDEDGVGKDRKHTFKNVINTLKQITKNKVLLKGAELTRITVPDHEQKLIMKHLGLKL